MVVKFVLYLMIVLSLAGMAFGATEWVDLKTQYRATAAQGDAADHGQVSEVDVDTSQPGRIDISMSVNGFWKTAVDVENQGTLRMQAGAPADVAVYDAINIPGLTHAQEVGKPSIPIKRLLLPLNGGQNPRVIARVTHEVSIGTLNVIPAQPLYMDVFPEPPRPAFQRDDALYAGSELYPPGNIVTSQVITMGNRTMLAVDVAPMRYVPGSGDAVVATDMEIEVVYREADFSIEAPKDAATLPIYMILMDDQFDGNSVLETFVDWKKRKGYDVRVVMTSDINASGAPSNAEIVAYMRGLPDADYPDYLLILGDQTAANGVEALYFTTYDGGYTDLDIACRTATDWIPDLYHGRMPATDNADATLMLSKALEMDRTPPTSGMFTNIIVAGQIQNSDEPTDNRADRLFCETGDSIATYYEQDPSGLGLSCTRAVMNPQNMVASDFWAWDGGTYSTILWGENDTIGDRIVTNFVTESAAQARMSAQLNAGAALIYHRDHGYSGGAGWADPDYRAPHINALTNGSNRPMVFSINCASGEYHKDGNFARAWLEHVNGGAYAVLAPVDISWSWLNDWFSHGVMAAFQANYISSHNASTDPNWSSDLPSPSGSYGDAGSATRLGEIMNFGKMYMYEKFYAHKQTFQLYHIFGDPESYLRLGNPQTLSVSHAGHVVLGAQTITVDAGEEGAYVCLYAPRIGLQQAQMTTGTSASFTVDITGNSTIYVTVTKLGRRPYEGTISASAGEPFSCAAFALTNNVVLRWTDPVLCGYLINTVRITSSTTDYPATYGEGTVVYTGTNITYTHEGLTPGESRYYSIWVTEDGVTWTNPP